uniref:Single domain-containing protein n=1 Tax=Amblyomma maculatum TaxID=34609 RepID=G3MPP9_AMBMU
MKAFFLILLAGVYASHGVVPYDKYRDESLHYQDGHCWFRGHSFKLGVPKAMENPCERWNCTKGFYNLPVLEVEGCAATNPRDYYTPGLRQDPKRTAPPGWCSGKTPDYCAGVPGFEPDHGGCVSMEAKRRGVRVLCDVSAR